MNELSYEKSKENFATLNAQKLSNQKRKLIVGIISPPFLMLSMFLIYNVLGLIFGPEIGWFIGLVIYWMFCGLLFSVLLIGAQKIKRMCEPQKFKIKMIPVILFPVIMAFIFSCVSGTDYIAINIWAIILLIITAFGNGIFEEILWRGVYMEIYPHNNFMRIGYSTIWYALFHFASGTLSSNPNVLGLVIGSAFFGVYLAFLAKWTNSIWWCILCHILGGFVMIL